MTKFALIAFILTIGVGLLYYNMSSETVEKTVKEEKFSPNKIVQSKQETSKELFITESVKKAEDNNMEKSLEVKKIKAEVTPEDMAMTNGLKKLDKMSKHTKTGKSEQEKEILESGLQSHFK